MRTIKFRAWDTKKQMMTGWPIALTIKPKTVLQKQSDGTLEILPYILTKDVNGVWTGEATSKYVLMQFTGLHDKNGVEIYEGDIVRNYWNDGSIKEDGQVDYDLGGFVACGQPLSDYLLDKGNIRAEVIGNIYESPELIK